MQTASLPRILGRYALYDEIASGGMATVHMGRLMGPVGFARTVAIKRLHPQFARDPEFVSMFMDEARLAARISHPNVVPTLDVVATEGELFLVMEYVRGESLSRLIRLASAQRERVPPQMASTILAGVLHGLHAAHEAKSERGGPLGIVHRDISPHNILVGVDGTPRVLDFGVAKAVGRIQTTREGQLKGKLAYMAPEQTHGRADRRTDVYAASVVLWEVLTGKRLFAGDHDAETLRRVLEGRVVPPGRHAPGVPRALDEITMKGLHTDPAKRFATARDMALALEDAIPVVAPSKIARWVEAMAAQMLNDRDKRLAIIESDSAIQPPHPAPIDGPVSARVATTGTPAPAAVDASSRPPASSVPPVPPAPQSPSVVVTDDMILTQLSSGSVSAPGRALALDSRKRRLLIAAAAVGLVAVVSVAIGLGRSSSSSRDRAPSTVASAAPASPPTTSTPPSPTVLTVPTRAAMSASPTDSASTVADPGSPPLASAAPSVAPVAQAPVAVGAPPRAPGSPLTRRDDVMHPAAPAPPPPSAKPPPVGGMPSARTMERVLDSRQ